MFADTNALATDERSRASVYEHTARTSCLGAAASLHELFRKVFMRQREENDLSCSSDAGHREC